MRRRMWSPEEDEKLQQWLLKHGHFRRWSEVATTAGLQRSGKSCRLRWINYLKPGLRRGKFSSEEIERVMKLHALYGNRWSKIASLMQGRTENGVKNLWNTKIKRLISKGNTTIMNNGSIHLSNLSNYLSHENIEEHRQNCTITNPVSIWSTQFKPRMFPFNFDSDNATGPSTLISSNDIIIPELEVDKESIISQVIVDSPKKKSYSFDSLNFNNNQDQEDQTLNHVLTWHNQQYYNVDSTSPNNEMLMNYMIDDVMKSIMNSDQAHNIPPEHHLQLPLGIDPPSTFSSSINLNNMYDKAIFQHDM